MSFMPGSNATERRWTLSPERYWLKACVVVSLPTRGESLDLTEGCKWHEVNVDAFRRAERSVGFHAPTGGFSSNNGLCGRITYRGEDPNDEEQ